jgi:hypothetical protein
MTYSDRELQDLYKAIDSYEHWKAHNYAIKDVHDTYPDEIWAALTTPDRIGRLLFRLELAEQQTLTAKLKRLGRWIVNAMACRF